MSMKKDNFSRRDFLRTAGAMGLGSMLSPVQSISSTKEESGSNALQSKVVPTRPFGKTGVNVSVLGLGGAFNQSNQILLRQAVKMGVTHWDTAEMYSAGKSEGAIGKYFQKYPDDRKKIFLVTKCASSDPRSLTKSLNDSLERLKTSYIDLYFVHMISNIYWINNDEIKAWAEDAKSKGKIRFFGFSTHANMEKCLQDAANLGWIDGVMATYNYRLMHTDSMKKAVDACAKAGIGLTAMKTQAKKSYGASNVGKETETAEKLTERFMEKGYTLEQAKLKAVWENENIASICSHMANMTVLQANVAAALSKAKLSFEERQLLDQYARKTASHYCAGCARNCEQAINGVVPISDVMRYLMYNRCYGQPERAKSAYNRLPSKVRKHMADINYRNAELKCPQGMQIGRLMREAASELV